jgi:hypothetical protein
MSAAEIIEEIKKLPQVEQEEVFALLTREVVAFRSTEGRSWLGRKLSFEQACDVVFRENRDLLELLAK